MADSLHRDPMMWTELPWDFIDMMSASVCRADSRFAHSQWETSLQSNVVSHWLGANLESALSLNSFKAVLVKCNLNKKAKHIALSIRITWVDLMSDSQHTINTPYLTPPVSYGVFIMSISEKNNCAITGSYCNLRPSHLTSLSSSPENLLVLSHHSV